MPALQERDPNRVRRRPGRCALMLVGETRRPGRSARAALRRPRRQGDRRALEEAGIEGRDLHHQCGKALQERAARQASSPQKPDISEIDACRWWLDNELEIVQPAVVVALGATAARGLFRKALGINANRGRLIALPAAAKASSPCTRLIAAASGRARQAARVRSSGVKDLRFAAEAAHKASSLDLGVGNLGDDDRRPI